MRTGMQFALDRAESEAVMERRFAQERVCEARASSALRALSGLCHVDAFWIDASDGN
jgi:hypothetical protein